MIHFLETFVISFPLFLEASLLTLKLTIISLIVSVIIGLTIALLALTNHRFWMALSKFYILVVRGTPLIVQIFVLYFGLTHIVKLSNFLSATLALAFHNGAYLSEIFRGAMLSIDRGQKEAALSLGMSPFQTFSRILLPQAFLRALPGIGNQMIIALKDSSLAAFISMDELFNVATTLGSNNFDQMTYLLIVAIYYLILVLALTQVVSKVEMRLRKSGAV